MNLSSLFASLLVMAALVDAQTSSAVITSGFTARQIYSLTDTVSATCRIWEDPSPDNSALLAVLGTGFSIAATWVSDQPVAGGNGSSVVTRSSAQLSVKVDNLVPTWMLVPRAWDSTAVRVLSYSAVMNGQYQLDAAQLFSDKPMATAYAQKTVQSGSLNNMYLEPIGDDTWLELWWISPNATLRRRRTTASTGILFNTSIPAETGSTLVSVDVRLSIGRVYLMASDGGSAGAITTYAFATSDGQAIDVAANFTNFKCPPDYPTPLDTHAKNDREFVLLCQRTTKLTALFQVLVYDLWAAVFTQRAFLPTAAPLVWLAGVDSTGAIVTFGPNTVQVYNGTGLGKMAELTVPTSTGMRILSVQPSRRPGFLVVSIAVNSNTDLLGMPLNIGTNVLMLQYDPDAIWRSPLPPTTMMAMTTTSAPTKLPTTVSGVPPANSDSQSSVLAAAVSSLVVVAVFVVAFIVHRRHRRPDTLDALEKAPVQNSRVSLVTAVQQSNTSSKTQLTDQVSFEAKRARLYGHLREADVTDGGPMTQTYVNSTRSNELSIPGFLMVPNIFRVFRLKRDLCDANMSRIFLVDILDPEIIERAGGERQAVIKSYLNMDQEKDFLQEVALLAFFRGDPQFLQLLAFSHNDMTICTRYYATGSLSDWRRRKKDGASAAPDYTPGVLRRFAADIADGLDKMHASGFVHSDVKPANILIDARIQLDETVEYVAVISDLGSTKIVDTQSLRVQAFTVVQKREATISYAAPEVVSRFYDVDGNKVTSSSDSSMTIQEAESTDVYGYGMVLYEMLTMERPYAQLKNNAEKARAILAGQRPVISDERLVVIRQSEVLSQLLEIMQQCCRVDPLARPSMQQILSRLRAELKDSTATSKATTTSLRE